MLKLKKLTMLVVGSFGVMNFVDSDAAYALTLNLYGTARSDIIRYEATGSITVNRSYPEERRGTGIDLPFLAPQLIGGPRYRWNVNHNFRLGNIFTNLSEADSIFNTKLPLSEGISYQVNGERIATLDRVTFNQSVTTSGLPLYQTIGSVITYPALDPDDEISWTGSGTVTLGEGTFETVFEAGRRGVALSYSNPLDDSILSGFDPETEPAFTVNVYPTEVVPEPLTILGAGTAVAFGAGFKRKLN